MTTVPVRQDGLIELVKMGIRNGNYETVVTIVEEWTLSAAGEVVRLREQRDALLAACKATEWVMRSHIMPEHFDGHAAKALEQVRAVIALAEEGAA